MTSCRMHRILSVGAWLIKTMLTAAKSGFRPGFKPTSKFCAECTPQHAWCISAGKSSGKSEQSEINIEHAYILRPWSEAQDICWDCTAAA